MAPTRDRHVYGFSRADAKALAQSIGTSEGTYREGKPRPQQFPRILFKITSATTEGPSSPYNGLTVATATVLAATCGRADLIDATVQVVDQSGCLFNEPLADLVNRVGWAFEGIAKDKSTGAAPDDLAPCHWIADGLCCPP